ncbi:hypothetical protein BCO71033_06744 [Burkholderia contaminans]|uniref:Uncharacterized protein n=1 Tax=Burkholderia contaminans TaxID=488447 RepID=A0A6P3C266_9BURK|nr:hypothetical protein BCO71033_06744 [Burkholderia contaminans]
MEFHFDANGTDGTRPLLYMREIHDAQTGELRGRYVGKAVRGSRRPRNHYARNVRRLLVSLPYRKGNPDGFRKVHRALAMAVLKGDRITLTLLRNVRAEEDINEAERTTIEAMGCTLNA